ncbi:uncharacterized protein MYCGRDRAFT_106385, partial [Zymoseptoria tritici IPO323]
MPPRRAARAAPAPPPPPPPPARRVTLLTTGSLLYRQTKKKAAIDAKNFSEVKKLDGSGNYNDWYNSIKIACRQAGIIDFFLGIEPEPIPLSNEEREELEPEEVNAYMLSMADWHGKNESLLGFIQSSCVQHMQ